MPELQSPDSSSESASPGWPGLRPLLREGPESHILAPIRRLDDLARGDTSPKEHFSIEKLPVTSGESPPRLHAEAHAHHATARRRRHFPFNCFKGWRSWVRDGDGLVGSKRGQGVEPHGRGRPGGCAGGGEEEGLQRVLHIGEPEMTATAGEYSGNTVKTSKYTIFTFLPRNLFEQFHRVAYIYFLIIAILNQIPVLAVFGRTASLFPLLSVLIVTAIKDAYEDWARHKADKEENNRECPALRNGRFEPIKWRHIRVGDVLRISSGEALPCDMVMLGCSDPAGRAYIETMNLDGETTLKSRNALVQTAQRTAEDGQLRGTITCEEPNRDIYSFTGMMEIDGMQLALGPSNMLLRGSELRNTAWVVGCVVYAGKETKAQLNNSGAQSKRSRLEHYMNRDVLFLAGILVVLCTIGAVGMGTWIADRDVYKLPYYGAQQEFHGSLGEGALNWFSCLIVFQIMVPISLYISMELVRLGQSYFMTRDLNMYDEESDSPLQVRALNINEDLGQIGYVLSDKTGTLTENRMEFHACTIWGCDYSNQQVQAKRDNEEASFQVQPAAEDSSSILEVLPNPWRPKAGTRVDPSLVRVLQSPSSPEQRQAVHDFLLTLAVCNTVVPTKVSRSVSGQLEQHAAGYEEGGWVEYQGESPDEQALVTAAAAYGISLLERNSHGVVVSVLGDIHRYTVLGVHEFDSDRKRMSVVVKCPDGSHKLLVKGADSVMFGLLNELSEGAPAFPGTPGFTEWEQLKGVYDGTLRDLDGYAREGLRTLVVAARSLDESEVATWQKKYHAASMALQDRRGKLQEAALLLERELDLLGGTGIEDKLQKGVPDTIATLRKAGIGVWVLTGDKQETAVSIAFACQLITRNMHQITINESTMEGTRKAIADAKTQFHHLFRQPKRFEKYLFWNKAMAILRGRQSAMGAEAAIAAADSNGGSPVNGPMTPGGRGINQRRVPQAFEGLPKMESPENQPELALVIDGNSLVHALEPGVDDLLYELASVCKVVLCCRVAPLQKASVVALVKRCSAQLCLAIGDGANDVSMIQMADVGVGISGQEGRQAVMASDFAIAQFRFLKRLLLVHGHWNYQRLAYMVLYNFYRNSVFVMMLFWFIFHTAFSPQTGISDWSLVFYSLLYTSVPTIVVGILEQDVRGTTLLKLPGLYSAGPRNEAYNMHLFWLMALDTLWQSLVLFYVPYFSSRHQAATLWGVGQIWMYAVVVVANLHLAMDLRHWTWLHHLVTWLSIALTFVVLIILDLLPGMPQYGSLLNTANTAEYWLDILLVLAVALMPRFIAKYLSQRLHPSDIQVALEAEACGRLQGTNEHSVQQSEMENILASPRQQL